MQRAATQRLYGLGVEYPPTQEACEICSPNPGNSEIPNVAKTQEACEEEEVKGAAC
jgi:hypothetical protein